MMSAINYFGAPLFAPGPEGKPTWLIATAFPHYDTVVTLRTIHALQIEAFVEAKRQRPAGAAPMTAEEEREIRKDAVPLVLDGDCVQIRPDPDDMPLAFQTTNSCEGSSRNGESSILTSSTRRFATR